LLSVSRSVRDENANTNVLAGVAPRYDCKSMRLPKTGQKVALAAYFVLGLLAAPFGALAEDEERETAAWSTTGLVLGIKAGAGVGAPFNDLGATFVGEVELGYALPLPEPIGRSFELFTAGAYLAPSSDGASGMPDPRLPGDGTFRYEVTQQAVVLTAGLRYRLSLADDTIAPYIAAGGRMYLMRTKIEGEVAGQSLGTTEETASAFGLHAAAGVDFRLGPGAVLAEAQLGYAGLDGYVMRDTNFGALVLLVGYRFMPMERRASSRPERTAPPDPAAEDESAPEPAPATAAPVPVEPAPSPEPEATPIPSPEPVGTAAPTAAAAAATAEPVKGQGQIQGNIRAFDGTPLQATVTVYPGNHKASTNAEGAFELNLKPGRYTIRLRAYGYNSQNRAVVVHENGVTVLNAELRKKK
jgi:hypothetical protein